MVPVEPSTRRLLLLGERKLNGLLDKAACRGSIITEITNMTIFATRITLRIPSSPPIPRVNILSFQIEPGFFNPQAGHTDADRLTSLLQLGQRRAFFLDEFIKGIRLLKGDKVQKTVESGSCKRPGWCVSVFPAQVGNRCSHS